MDKANHQLEASILEIQDLKTWNTETSFLSIIYSEKQLKDI